MDSDFEQYEERAMIHSIIEAPEKRLDLNLLSKELQLGQRQVSELLEEVKSKLQRQISQRLATLSQREKLRSVLVARRLQEVISLFSRLIPRRLLEMIAQQFAS